MEAGLAELDNSSCALEVHAREGSGGCPACSMSCPLPVGFSLVAFWPALVTASCCSSRCVRFRRLCQARVWRPDRPPGHVFQRTNSAVSFSENKSRSSLSASSSG